MTRALALVSLTALLAAGCNCGTSHLLDAGGRDAGPLDLLDAGEDAGDRGVDAGCDCPAERPVCDPTSDRCVECVSDAQCDLESTCDVPLGECVRCQRDADCGVDMVCVGGTCGRECGRAVAPTTAALCAPGACVALDQRLLDGPHFRNGVPAAGFTGSEAVVVYATAEGGYAGDRVVPGQMPERLPFALATAAFAVVDGAEWLVPDDGAFGLTLRRRTPGAWLDLGRLRGHAGAGTLAVDDTDCAYLLYERDDGAVRMARHAGSGWAATTLAANGGGSEQMRLVLASDGTPHMIWSTPSGSRPDTMSYRAGSGPTETLLGIGEGGVSGIWLTLASDEPHLLTRLETSTGEIVLQHRARDAAGWRTTAFASSTPERCFNAPSTDGERCDFTSADLHPLAIVSDGVSDVRVIVGEVTTVGRYVGSCRRGPGPPTCTWSGSETRTGRVLMGAPDAAGAISLSPVTGATLPVTAGHAVVAPDGTIHVAAYGPPPSDVMASGAGSQVVYLAIGAR